MPKAGRVGPQKGKHGFLKEAAILPGGPIFVSQRGQLRFLEAPARFPKAPS